MKILTVTLLLTLAAAELASAMPSSKATCSRAAVIECKVDGEDSPEAALRQVDAWALESMYCATGCDAVINRDVAHPYATTIRPTCSVSKHEDTVEYKKFKAKDNNRDSDKRSQRARRLEVAKRDIDAYTVQSATFQFCCNDSMGNDHTKEAAEYIGLELSICKQLL